MMIYNLCYRNMVICCATDTQLQILAVVIVKPSILSIQHLAGGGVLRVVLEEVGG